MGIGSGPGEGDGFGDGTGGGPTGGPGTGDSFDSTTNDDGGTNSFGEGGGGGGGQRTEAELNELFERYLKDNNIDENPDITEAINDFKKVLKDNNQQFLDASFEGLTDKQVNTTNTNIEGFLDLLSGAGDDPGLIADARSRGAAALSQFSGNNVDFGSLSASQVSSLNTGLSGLLAPSTQQGLTEAQQRSQLSALSGIQGGTGTIADRLQAIGTGGIDPRFEQVRQAQLAQLAANEAGQQGRVSENFSRRGFGGSAAALTAGNQIGSQFDRQRSSLTANLGLQALQRGDVALQNALAARGQQFGQQQAQFNTQLAGLASRNQANQQNFSNQFQTRQQQFENLQTGVTSRNAAETARLGALATGNQLQLGNEQLALAGLTQGSALTQQQLTNTLAGITSRNEAESLRLGAVESGIQNAAIPAGLDIAQLAAQVSGEGGGGGGGGLTIICSELYRQGLMGEDIYKADNRFGLVMRQTQPEVMAGYHIIAAPIVRLMKKSKIVTHIVNVFASPWAKEMASIVGKGKGNWFGKVVMKIGIPLCRFAYKRKTAVI